MSNWISDNTYLTRAQMENNAAIIYRYMSSRGWSDTAIAGMLGNMEAESTISPGRYEVGGVGFGLVQWTPPSKLWDWIQTTYGNEDYSNGYYQLNRILWELENGGQYYQTPSYPLSFQQYVVSNQSSTYLAGAWLVNYERSSDTSAAEQARRGAMAESWLTYINTLPPVPELDIPLWLLFRFNKRR